MPRDLADVLHYFLPELEESTPSPEHASDIPSEPASETDGEIAARKKPRRRGGDGAPPLPILGLPVGTRDVVRAALAWNLAIETARLGATTILLAPEADRGSPLWPEPGVGPLGCELVFCPAKDIASLYEAAAEVARRRAYDAKRGGVVFLRIPPEWISKETAPQTLVRWFLLLSAARQEDLSDTLAFARTMVSTHPGAEIGLSVHGVSKIAQARKAYESLAKKMREELSQDLISYGLLVDDLHVYRAIAAQRPIGLAHPQSPAARALGDVARLIYEDARSRVLG